MLSTKSFYGDYRYRRYAARKAVGLPVTPTCKYQEKKKKIVGILLKLEAHELNLGFHNPSFYTFATIQNDLHLLKIISCILVYFETSEIVNFLLSEETMTVKSIREQQHKKSLHANQCLSFNLLCLCSSSSSLSIVEFVQNLWRYPVKHLLRINS